MTSDETGSKRNETDEQNDNNDDTTSSQDDKNLPTNEQTDSTSSNDEPWTSSRTNPPVKASAATNKRTFDQISDPGQQQTSDDKNSSCSIDDEKNQSEATKDINIDNANQENKETIDKEEENGNNSIESENNQNESSDVIKDPVKFKVVYAKEIYDIVLDQNDTILKLKEHLQKLTSITSSSQKLCYKGNLNESKTLKECAIKDGVKVMMIGSKTNDILAVSSVTKNTVVKETKESTPVKEPLCQQKLHKKIIEKGLPDQVMSAWIGEDCPLPMEPLTGMLNRYGNKVRMTFKLEQDEVWISTKERTQKLQMTSIKSVISEPIENYEHYHIMALQIGPTEASRIWLYWVPAQYIRAIKNVILNS